MRTVAVAFIAGALGGFLGAQIHVPFRARAQTTQTIPLVQARDFRLVDTANRLKARLTVFSDGTELDFYDNAGKARTGIGFADQAGTAVMALLDSAGKPRALGSLDSGGTTAFTILDGQGRVRAVLGMPAVGVPGLAFVDENGSITRTYQLADDSTVTSAIAIARSLRLPSAEEDR